MRKGRAIGLILCALFAVAILRTLLTAFCQCVGLTPLILLAAILLQREQQSTRAELLQQTGRIRKEAKNQIDSGNMTLDGLTAGQINAAFKNTPKLRQSFQRILSIMSG